MFALYLMPDALFFFCISPARWDWLIFFFFVLRCRFFFGLQDCIVCQELYTVGATLVRLPCGHLYHEVSKSYVQLQSVPGV